MSSFSPLIYQKNAVIERHQIEGNDLLCTVVQGGVLKDRKGINLPDSNVSAPSLTQKDRIDAAFALDLPVDFLALSFVRKASDVIELRSLIEKQGQLMLERK